jgi:Protein of unknown function (DUF2796)
MTARRWLTAALCLCVGAVVIVAAMPQVATSGDGKSSPSGAKRRHQHGAHVHGTAKLNIAVEENTATVEFEAPAESIIGFEHKAKTAADQRKQATALDLLKNNIGGMLIFESGLGCRLSPTSLDVVQQSDEHAEVHGVFAVACDSPLAGSKLRFAFTKTFPAMRTVNVQVVAATQQVGATIKQDRGEVEVPR